MGSSNPESGNQSPFLTIITVCYNSSKTIDRTLKSVADQDFDDYEYLIIDGGSKDETLDIVDRYRSTFGDRLKVISEPDNGIYDAMNKGIRMASGRLIGIINSDDRYEKGAFKAVADSYDNEKHLVIYGMMRKVQDGKELETVIYNHENLDNQMINHPTCFVTKDTYQDFGMFDLKYRSSADYELMLRLYHETDTIFKPVYSIIADFELGGMSGSQTGYRETLQLMKRYGTISSGTYIRKVLKSHVYDFVKGRKG